MASNNRDFYNHQSNHRRRNQRSLPNDGDGKIIPMLRTQIEYYFSQENLVHDDFLLSFLYNPNHPGSIPTEVICNFPRVREAFALSVGMGRVPTHMAPVADPQFVLHALEGSTDIRISDDGCWLSPVNFDLQLHSSNNNQGGSFGEQQYYGNETRQGSGYNNHGAPPVPPAPPSTPNQTFWPGQPMMGAPQMPRERNTIIVREVPENASVDQILDAFSFNGIHPKHAKRAQSDTWYVDFESEQEAIEALNFTKGRTIGGKPVRGGLKSIPPPGFMNGMPMNNFQQNQFLPIYGNNAASNGNNQAVLIGHVAGYTPDMGVPVRQPMQGTSFNAEHSNHQRQLYHAGNDRPGSASFQRGQGYQQRPHEHVHSPKKKSFKSKKSKANYGQQGGMGNDSHQLANSPAREGEQQPPHDGPSKNTKQYNGKQARGTNGKGKPNGRHKKSIVVTEEPKDEKDPERTETLDPEKDFPTLAGTSPVTPPTAEKAKARPAYAEALRKKSGDKSTDKRELVSPVAVEDIEKGVQGLAVGGSGDDDDEPTPPFW